MNTSLQGRRRGAAVARPAVMADVARLARVSYQTVSRVLHDSPHVHRDTRERVLAAIRELDYRPNSVARALVTGRSRTLGVVSFDTTLYGPASTLLGIEQAAHDADYAVIIASLKTLTGAAVLDAVQRLRDHGAGGVAVIAPQQAAVEGLGQLPAGLPVVAVEVTPRAPVPFVTVDQVGGAVAATRHLLELGHRTVWHIAGPSGWLEADQRIEGWRRALRAARAPIPAVVRGDWSPRSGYELGRALLRERDVTAVFVANDQMALGLLRLLHEVGRDTPRTLSVVGFDDIPEAAYFTPPLTTVRQDFAELGRRCVHLLLGQLERPGRSRKPAVIPATLVVRGSSGPAPR